MRPSDKLFCSRKEVAWRLNTVAQLVEEVAEKDVATSPQDLIDAPVVKLKLIRSRIAEAVELLAGLALELDEVIEAREQARDAAWKDFYRAVHPRKEDK